MVGSLRHDKASRGVVEMTEMPWSVIHWSTFVGGVDVCDGWSGPILTDGSAG